MILAVRDFNQLPGVDIVECTGLLSIVTQPTRAVSYIDRIYISSIVYSIVRVVKSLVRSDDNAVVAYADRPQLTNKTVAQKTFRRIYLSLPARCLSTVYIHNWSWPFYTKLFCTKNFWYFLWYGYWIA